MKIERDLLDIPNRDIPGQEAVEAVVYSLGGEVRMGADVGHLSHRVDARIGSSGSDGSRYFLEKRA